MKRLPEWEIKLAEFLKENRERDFEWGKWDCCIFANACLKVISGKNVIPKTLKWKDEKTAYKAIKDYGGTLDQALEKAALAAGMIPVEPQYVTTGDLVVVSANDATLVIPRSRVEEVKRIIEFLEKSKNKKLL